VKRKRKKELRIQNTEVRRQNKSVLREEDEIKKAGVRNQNKIVSSM